MAISIFFLLPEGAPADVGLAEVLVIRGLLDEPHHLLRDVERHWRVKVAPRQLVADAVHDVQSLLVQGLGLVVAVKVVGEGRARGSAGSGSAVLIGAVGRPGALRIKICH